MDAASKISRRFKQIFKSISNPRLALYIVSKNYIKNYEGFSYHFQYNGERLLIERLKDHNIKTVFDVGANIGGWSQIALNTFAQAEVHSFELVNETYESLKNNIHSERAILNQSGLADDFKTVEFKYYGANKGINKIGLRSVFHDHYLSFEKRTALVTTLDKYCADNNIEEIDLLKIDVEGAEHLVLKGATRMLSEKRIRVIQFEYGYSSGDNHYLIRDFYDLLKAYGYLLGPLKYNGVWFMDFDYGLNNFNSGPNFVAVLESEKEIIKMLGGAARRGYPVR